MTKILQWVEVLMLLITVIKYKYLQLNLNCLNLTNARCLARTPMKHRLDIYDTIIRLEKRLLDTNSPGNVCIAYRIKELGTVADLQKNLILETSILAQTEGTKLLAQILNRVTPCTHPTGANALDQTYARWLIGGKKFVKVTALQTELRVRYSVI